MEIIANNIVYIFAAVGIVLFIIFFAFWIINGSASKYPIITTIILVVLAAIIGAYIIYKFTGGLSITEELNNLKSLTHHK
ncbi:MAG: hypothetical protein VZQ55_02030 [Ruminococcus sp.]|nr:hypothetical protein [Ruminococcus sp.]